MQPHLPAALYQPVQHLLRYAAPAVWSWCIHIHNIAAPPIRYAETTRQLHHCHTTYTSHYAIYERIPRYIFPCGQSPIQVHAHLTAQCRLCRGIRLAPVLTQESDTLVYEELYIPRQ